MFAWLAIFAWAFTVPTEAYCASWCDLVFFSPWHVVEPHPAYVNSYGFTHYWGFGPQIVWRLPVPSEYKSQEYGVTSLAASIDGTPVFCFADASGCSNAHLSGPSTAVTVLEGNHTIDVTCSGVYYTWEDGVPIVHNVTDTQQAQFIIDISSPIPNWIQPIERVFALGSTITFRGTLVDANPPMTGASLRGMNEIMIIQPDSFDGEDFVFTLYTSSVLPVPPGTTKTFSPWISAVDAAGNYTTPEPTIDITIDGTPPEVAFKKPDLFYLYLYTFDGVSGTIDDDNRLGAMTIRVQDETSGKYWDPGVRRFVSSGPVEMPIPINTGQDVRHSDWLFPQIGSRDLAASHTYRFTTTAQDYFGNQKQDYWQFTYLSLGAVWRSLSALVFNAAGEISITPKTAKITWGGASSQKFSVTVSQAIQEKDSQWLSRIKVKNDDGTLEVVEDITSDYWVRSNGSCARFGRVNVYYGESIVASADVEILAPTGSIATLPAATTNIKDCRIIAGLSNNDYMCRGDIWDISIQGDSQMDLRSADPLQKLYEIEDQSGERALGDLPLCPIGRIITQKYPFPIDSRTANSTDKMSYFWEKQGAANFKHCGGASVQHFVFYPLSPSVEAVGPGCRFVSGINKTKKLSATSDLTTWRSDGNR